MKSGVKSDVAEQALNEVYNATDSTEIARKLAIKKAGALRRLDPITARRRLVGLLQRRGFEYEAIKTVIDEVLGKEID
jgi:regulatory protein